MWRAGFANGPLRFPVPSCRRVDLLRHRIMYRSLQDPAGGLLFPPIPPQSLLRRVNWWMRADYRDKGEGVVSKG